MTSFHSSIILGSHGDVTESISLAFAYFLRTFSNDTANGFIIRNNCCFVVIQGPSNIVLLSLSACGNRLRALLQ